MQFHHNLHVKGKDVLSSLQHRIQLQSNTKSFRTGFCQLLEFHSRTVCTTGVQYLSGLRKYGKFRGVEDSLLFGVVRNYATNKRRPKHNAFSKMRRHALLGVRFPMEAAFMEKEIGDKGESRRRHRDGNRELQTQESRPRNLFGVRGKDIYISHEDNSVELQPLPEMRNQIAEEKKIKILPGNEAGNGSQYKSLCKDPSMIENIIKKKLKEENEELTDTADLLFKELAELETFRQFNLGQNVQAMILKSGLTTPTELQKLVIPKLLKGMSSLVVGPTGSGKTAAYLLPLVSRLSDSDVENLAPYPGRPRLIILTPTQELVDQTTKTVQRLVPRSTGLRLGKGSLRTVGSKIQQKGEDVLVATPQRLLSHFVRGEVRFNKIEAVVIDEADLMCVDPLGQTTLSVLKLLKLRGSREMGKLRQICNEIEEIVGNVNDNLKITLKREKRFVKETPNTIDIEDESYESEEEDDKIMGIKHLKNKPRKQNNSEAEEISVIQTQQETNLPQLVFVTATKTAGLTAFIQKHLPDHLTPIISVAAHLIGSEVHQVFVPIKENTRMGRLHEILEETKAGKKTGQMAFGVGGAASFPDGAYGNSNQTIVFTNSILSCKYVARELKASGYNSVPLHGDLKIRERSVNYKSFLAKKTKILVATNLASRGLDIPSVGNIIMFQCPRTTADYIHRAGRASRAGYPGRISTIYSRRDSNIIKEIQMASRSGRQLDVRDPPNILKRGLLAKRNWQLEVASKVKRLSKKHIQGLSIKRRNCASRQTKWVMKKEYFRAKMLVEQKRLFKMGVVPKHGPFPIITDRHIEESESKTFLRMIRSSDGLLQALPMTKVEYQSQRRRLEQHNHNEALELQGAARPSVSPEQGRRFMEKIKQQHRSPEF